jgi:bla regulator protein blaR1
MWGEVDRFSRVLADATLAETIFLSLVVLVMLLCQQPARRISLAKAAILLSTLMIPLVASSPLPRFHPRLWFGHHERGSPAPGAGRVEDPQTPAVTRVSPEENRQPSAGISRKAGWWTAVGAGRILTLVYLTGVSIGLVWLLLGFGVLAKVVRRADAPSPATQAFYHDLVGQAGRGMRAPRLLVSTRVRRPVLAGFVDVCILIPPEYDQDQFERDSLRIILNHELAHAAQRDSRFSAGASLAQSLWFFLPFLWWLRIQLRTDQEFLADKRTAEGSGSPAGYAKRLVNLAAPREQFPFRRPIIDTVPTTSGHWRNGGSKSQLLQRVVMLLHAPFPIELHPPRWWSLSARLLVLGLAVLCSTASVSSSGRETLVAASATLRASVPTRFHVSQFVASPQVVSRSGRSTPYALPLPLPDCWDLRVDIQASPSALRRIRIAGILIDRSDEPFLPSPESRGGVDSSPAWHQVHLWHDGQRTQAEIDGRDVLRKPDREPLSEWLTIEPAPDETALLRNLTVTW